MPDRDCGPHCPFLNRSDTRCSEFFSLDHLQHAFEVCFGAYKACPAYAELLNERQERRVAAAACGHGAGSHDRYELGAPRYNGWVTATTLNRDPATAPHATHRLVQVSVSPRLAQLARGLGRAVAHHHAQHAAAGPGVSAPPGF